MYEWYSVKWNTVVTTLQMVWKAYNEIYDLMTGPETTIISQNNIVNGFHIKLQQ